MIPPWPDRLPTRAFTASISRAACCGLGAPQPRSCCARCRLRLRVSGRPRRRRWLGAHRLERRLHVGPGTAERFGHGQRPGPGLRGPDHVRRAEQRPARARAHVAGRRQWPAHHLPAPTSPDLQRRLAHHRSGRGQLVAPTDRPDQSIVACEPAVGRPGCHRLPGRQDRRRRGRPARGRRPSCRRPAPPRVVLPGRYGLAFAGGRAAVGGQQHLSCAAAGRLRRVRAHHAQRRPDSSDRQSALLGRSGAHFQHRPRDRLRHVEWRAALRWRHARLHERRLRRRVMDRIRRQPGAAAAPGEQLWPVVLRLQHDRGTVRQRVRAGAPLQRP